MQYRFFWEKTDMSAEVSLHTQRKFALSEELHAFFEGKVNVEFGARKDFFEFQQGLIGNDQLRLVRGPGLRRVLGCAVSGGLPCGPKIKGFDAIWYLSHNFHTAYDIEFADEFGAWWDSLSVAEQRSVTHGVDLLQYSGPMLSRPHAHTIKGSQYANMKELRVQHEGRPYRVLFAFDPRRTGLLLIGGDKTGNNR